MITFRGRGFGQGTGLNELTASSVGLDEKTRGGWLVDSGIIAPPGISATAAGVVGRERCADVFGVPETGVSRAMLGDSSRALLGESSRALLGESSRTLLGELSRAMLDKWARAMLGESSRAMLGESARVVLGDASRVILGE